MENTLYYAFSTIAATFGSAFGLIVAAAIFRIQRIDQIASPLSEKLSQAPSVAENRLELERITTVYNWKKYVKRWKEIDGQLKEGDPRYEATLWWLLKEIAHR
ncbi:MAG TPA: hypothetical protein VF590_03165, partial [Isosphaeraceae bacterium]